MDAVFVALADSTRRRVLELLAAESGATATQLSASFPVTRQAIAKHLQVLADAGLATSERHGRELRWSLTPEALSPAMAWMASIGGTFEGRLSALQRHLDERRAERQLGITPRPAPISAPIPLPVGPLRIGATGRPPRPDSSDRPDGPSADHPGH